MKDSWLWFLLITATAGGPAAAAQPQKVDEDTAAAILATCHDYIEGQLQADPDRVAKSLHPALAKRRVIGETPEERFGLRRMTKEELVSLTQRAALKTPESEWDRSCTILDVSEGAASVRLETPWFVDYFHMGNFEGRWIIVNALWNDKSE